MKTREELMSAGLPKWPQMLVTGTTLPAEQALEIIRRTDHFFLGYSGNDHDFISKARKLCCLPYAVCPNGRTVISQHTVILTEQKTPKNVLRLFGSENKNGVKLGGLYLLGIS